MFIKSLVIHPADNVAVVLEDAHKGDYIEQRGEQVTLLEDIEFAHKVALGTHQNRGLGTWQYLLRTGDEKET